MVLFRTWRLREFRISAPSATAIVSANSPFGLERGHRALPPLVLRCSSGLDRQRPDGNFFFENAMVSPRRQRGHNQVAQKAGQVP
jgi:hypothetical protein